MQASYLDTTNEEAWNDLLCNRKCMRLADGLYEDEPLCVQCADEQLEYDCAVAIRPTLVHDLLAPNKRD